MKIHNFVLSNLLVMMISGGQAGTVTNNEDSGAGSLRDVLGAASDNEVINFAAGLNGTTITLSSGSLSITGLTLTLDASALPSGIKLSGNKSSRILTIVDNADVTLRSLHLRDGRENEDNGGGLKVFSSHLVLDACSIQDCVSAFDGGGLWGNGMTGSIQRCKIAGNESGSFGGGIFLIGINGTKSLDISNSQISGNVAAFGAGIDNFRANPTLSNCTIQGNSGGGLCNQSGSAPVLRNCIVWGNAAANGSTASQQLRNFDGSHPDIDHCLIEGASDAASFGDATAVAWGNGNLDGTLAGCDPCFVAAVSAAKAPSSASDLRVFTNSPCLNVDDNGFSGTAMDLAANARQLGVTTNLGGGGRRL